MSTKNLARTVIEGGRAPYNRWQRWSSNGEHRVHEREALARLRAGASFDDLVVPERKQVRRDFADKLGPPKRWLASQVGRPWRLVYADLLQRFDTRTTAGRHIVFDHMLPWVRRDGACASHYSEFEVDGHGLLRRRDRPRFKYWRVRDALPREEGELMLWLNGRRVGAYGEVLFWHTPTSTGAFRQERRLEERDVALWRSLPEWFRDQNDPSAPTPVPAQTRN